MFGTKAGKSSIWLYIIYGSRVFCDVFCIFTKKDGVFLVTIDTTFSSISRDMYSGMSQYSHDHYNYVTDSYLIGDLISNTHRGL